MMGSIVEQHTRILSTNQNVQNSTTNNATQQINQDHQDEHNQPTKQKTNSRIQSKEFNQTQLTDLQNTTSHIAFGDEMGEKRKGSIRLYLQNINGSKLATQTEAWTHAVNYIESNSIDYIGLVETRVEWNNSNQTIVKKHLNKKFAHNLLLTSMCSPNQLNEGSPGGTASIAINQLVNRKLNNIIDTSGLGRWTGATFALPSYRLHVITCYRPNRDNKTNSNTTYQQQTRILRQQGVKNPNPTEQVLTDLTTLIKRLHQQQDKIILMWDANDTLQHNDIQKFQSQTELVSTHQTS
jgi:hypothetical protein